MSDSGSILNDAEVDFLLEGSDGQGKDGAADGQQVVTMRGDLQQINLTDIFQTLSLSKMEGMLRVRNPLEQRHLYFKDGFVRILVPNRIATRRLGQRLVHAGVIDSDKLRSSLLQQRKDNKPLGQILIEMGACTQEQIDDVLAMQVTEELFALFTWRHGEFEFFRGEVTDQALRTRLQNTPEFEVGSLLLEVARRSDEWDGITGSLGCLDEVPIRLPDAAPDLQQLGEAQQSLLAGIDGKQSYRELAETQLLTLFDAARAARDLVKQGVIVNQPDDGMVQVARDYAAQGHPKRALVVLQTLRDRDGERLLTTICEIAEVLRACGEGKLACGMLLEAAELQTDADCALDLARQARALAPRDADVLRFLRKGLTAHGDAAGAELEEVTLALVDSLLDAGDPEPALLLVDEGLKTTTNRVPLLQRRVRVLQKKKDTPGAVDTLLELAGLYQAEGNKEKVLELYEQVLKLDRDRKDVLKAVRALRTTRMMRYVRTASIGAAVVIALGAGIVLWRDSVRDQQLQEASTQILRLVRSGDRDGARSVLAKVGVAVGACTQLEDLQRQIDFAEATEQAKARRIEQKRNKDKLAEAATQLQQGNLGKAFSIYDDLHSREELRQEITEVVTTRLQVLQTELESIAKNLPARLPPPPAEVNDKRRLEESLADLRTRYQPIMLVICGEVQRLHDAGGFPGFVTQEQIESVTKAAATARVALERGKERLAEYEQANDRAQSQRRLDPLFKSAQELERNLDFRGALQAYRELDKETQNDSPLKGHFREQVERFATIVRFLDAVAKATAEGDFKTSQSQYRALRLAYPEVPFERVARLPLQIRSRPAGATVIWNGVESGKTPMLVSYLPGETNQVVLRLTGFCSEQATITGDTAGSVESLMTSQAGFEAEVEGAIERACASDGRDRLYITDRSGTVTGLEMQTGKVAWRWHSGDLSGLLSTPVPWKDVLLVSSLDGTLRALRADTGLPAWSQAGLPCEGNPGLAGDHLLLATTDKKLVLVAAADGSVQATLPLAAPVQGDLMVFGKRAAALLEDGTLLCVTLPDLGTAWSTRAGTATSFAVTAVKDGIAIADENGAVTVFDLATGNQRWRAALGGHLAGGLCTDGRMLAAVASERVVLFDLRDGSQKAVAQAGEADSWSGQGAFAGNRLFVPRRDGNLLALDRTTLEVVYQIRGGKRSQPRPVSLGSTGLAVGYSDRKLAVFRTVP